MSVQDLRGVCRNNAAWAAGLTLAVALSACGGNVRPSPSLDDSLLAAEPIAQDESPPAAPEERRVVMATLVDEELPQELEVLWLEDPELRLLLERLPFLRHRVRTDHRYRDWEAAVEQIGVFDIRLTASVMTSQLLEAGLPSAHDAIPRHVPYQPHDFPPGMPVFVHLPALGSLVFTEDAALAIRLQEEPLAGLRIVLCWPISDPHLRFPDSVPDPLFSTVRPRIFHRGHLGEPLGPCPNDASYTLYAVEPLPQPTTRHLRISLPADLAEGRRSVIVRPAPAELDHRWREIPELLRWLLTLIADDEESPANVGSWYTARLIGADHWIAALPTGTYQVFVDGEPSATLLQIPPGEGTVAVTWDALQAAAHDGE